MGRGEKGRRGEEGWEREMGRGEKGRGRVGEGCEQETNLQCGRCSYIQNEGDTVLGVIHSIDCMKGREGIHYLSTVR